MVMPLAMQHYLLLQRNLVYTGMTRGRRLVVLMGSVEGPLHGRAQQPDRPPLLRPARSQLGADAAA